MKIGKYKVSDIKILRGISQLVFFVFLPALFISTFSGIKQIYLAVAHQSFGISLLPQMIEAIAVIPLTILLGRFFCGWMCAFGAIGDFISFVSLRLFKRTFRIDPKIDRVLKYAKYAVLAFLVVAVWSFGIQAFSSANPWDAFGMLMTFGKSPDISYVISNLLPAFVILLFIIAGSFFVERFFCRYLCPLGAVFTMASKLRITGIVKPRAKCGSCRACTKSCPMGIELYKSDKIKSGECLNCFECVAACPRRNTAFAVNGGDMRPLVAGTVAAASIAGIYYAGSFTVDAAGLATASASVSQSQSDSQTQSGSSDASPSGSAQSSAASSSNEQSQADQFSSSFSQPTASSSKYKDGTYEGSGSGFRGATTTVSVTVKNDKITAVSVVSYGDDERFFSYASTTVISEIINNQSAEVDAVSGATYSSNGIMQAVAEALSKAML